MKRLLYVILFLPTILLGCSNREETDKIQVDESSLKEVIITASSGANPEDFMFSPSEVTLKQGESIKLTLQSDDQVQHDLWLPKLKNGKISEGQSVIITGDEIGEFNGQCSKLCGSGHALMNFKLIVIE